MLQFQEFLSIYKIEFWCELTIVMFIWENVDLSFRQKYILASRLGGGGPDLEVVSTHRIQFLICE